MSKRNPKPEEIVIDAYVPNWRRKCGACDARPTVEGVKDLKTIRLADLCGPCTFGTSDATDPAEWNRLL